MIIRGDYIRVRSIDREDGHSSK